MTNPSRQLWAVSLPLILSSFSNFIFQITDAAILASLGSKVLGAAAFAGAYLFIAMSLSLGFSLGIQSLFAEAGVDRDKKENLLSSGFWTFLTLGLLCYVASLLIFPIWLKANDNLSDISGLCITYVNAAAPSLVFYALNRFFSIYFVSQKKTKIILWITISIQILNLLLNICLVHGVSILPALGIKGAALGTTISMLVEVLLYIFFLFREGGSLPKRLCFVQVKKIIQAGYAPAANQISFSVYWNLLHVLATMAGTNVLVILSVFLKLSLFTTYIFFGLGTGGASLLRKSVDSAEIGLAWIHLRNVILKNAFFSLAIAILILTVFKSFFLRLYFIDSSVLELAQSTYPFLMLYLCFDSVGQTLQRFSIGAGLGGSVFKINLWNQIIFGLVASYALTISFNFGMAGLLLGQSLYRSANAFGFFKLTTKYQHENTFS